MNAPHKSRTRDRSLLEGVIHHLGNRLGLTSAQANSIACRSWMLAHGRGEFLVQRGNRLPGVLLVAYGTLKLVLRGSDGEERLVRLVSAAQLFGEAAALLGKACPFDAIAVTECKLAVIPSVVVLATMEQDARFASRFALMLAERNHELLAELESATIQRGAQRLASYLESLWLGDASLPYMVSLPVSKTLVAAQLGMKKETLSRLLRQFIVERLIAVSQREVQVLDGPGLAEVARTS